MEEMNENYIEMNVEDLTRDGGASEEMLMAPMEGDMAYESETNSNNSPMNGNVILGIVIAVCAIIGIALGILVGRKSAMK